MLVEGVGSKMRSREAGGLAAALGRAIMLLAALTGLVTGAPARAQETPLILGVFPRLNPSETTTRYAPLADHLSLRLGRKVTLATSRDFESFWRGIREQRYDIVQYNQYHYIRSAKTYQVIAHNKEFGRSTIAGVLYVRKDSNITTLAQLRGKTVLFGGGEDAMIGYIAPMFMLGRAGLKKGDFNVQFAVNPINSVIGVARNQADAAGSGDQVLEQSAVKSAINTEDLTVLATSEQLLHLPWAVRRTLSPKLREQIQSTLIDLDKDDAGRKVLKSAVMTGIGKADDKDYDPHRAMIKAVMGSVAVE